jgi:6-phosphogluconolactonase
MQFAMQIEVYPTDADAVDAAAALVAAHVLRAASARRPTVVLAGGRSGRAVMVALAGRGDLPWARVEWYLADERCGAPGDPLAHAKVARETLFGPRGVAPALVHGPAVAGVEPAAAAAAYATALEAALDGPGAPDVVVLGIGADGALGALAPACAALDAPGLVAVVPAASPEDPPRLSMTPALFARAGHVVVTAVGPETAGAVAAALRHGTGPAGRVLPSERITWVVDRAAADGLLKDATPVAEGGPS